MRKTRAAALLELVPTVWINPSQELGLEAAWAEFLISRNTGKEQSQDPEFQKSELVAV